MNMADTILVELFDPPAEDGQPFAKIVTFQRAHVELTENFYTGGSFTINYPVGGRASDELRIGRFVRINGYFGGFIDNVRLTGDASGQTLTASGFDVRALLKSRSVRPPDHIGVSQVSGFDAQLGATETLIKHFIQANFIAPAHAPRRIPGIRAAPDLKRGIPDDRMAARDSPVLDIVSELAENAALGLVYTIDPEAGTLIFDCAEGVNRTAGQPAPVLFSFSRLNVTRADYLQDEQNMRNVFYTTVSGAEFADEALTMTYWRDEEPEPSGWARKETHMSLSVNTPITGDEYNELKRQATAQMVNFESALSLTIAPNTGRNQYRKHFNLGDFVTAQNEDWGVVMNAQITSVATRADGIGRTHEITLGKGRPNPFQLVRRDIRNGG